MSKADRAKLFNPFDALKGLQEALREKERELEYEDRKELSSEKIEEISQKLQLIEEGSLVRIKYYCNRQYLNIEGIITKFDKTGKKLIINDTKINFLNIYEIEIL